MMCDSFQNVLLPRESAKFIADKALDVKICRDSLQKLGAKLADEFSVKKFSLGDWKENEVNPKTANDAAIDWIFFVDSLNFCFWTANSEPPFTVSFHGKSYTGYFSLCASVQRALEEGIPLTNPNYYARVTIDELKRIFRSDAGVEMPLLHERLRVLHETGSVLLEKFGGSFKTCVEQCDRSAQSLLDLVVRSFPSYRDEATYSGCGVSFYKRAQILIADVWACFEGKGLGEFHDIDTVTMFADYRVPQVLVHFGVLRYSPELMTRLEAGTVMENKGRHEVEIRGCAIHAVELLVNELWKVASERNADDDMKSVNSIVVDFFLWDYRRANAKLIDEMPFHKVRCIYY